MNKMWCWKVLLKFLLLRIIREVVAGNELREYRATYSIPENSPASMKIGTVAEESFLAGRRSPFHRQPGYRYALNKENPYFQLDPETSELKTRIILDCEAICSNNECSNEIANLTLIVNVWRVKQLRAFIRITVLVEDINDNDPEFPEPKLFTKSVKEVIYTTGKKINLPRATDLDISKANREIRYKLIPAGANEASTFSLDVSRDNRPSLKLERDLDYEERTSYRLTLKAWNPSRPNRATWLKIKILVSNMNDNEPKFDKNVYHVNVAEDLATNSIFLKLNATDEDTGTQLEYSLNAETNSDVSRTFVVESDGRLRLIKALDFEQTQRYTLRVQVSDGEFTAATKVAVKVIDVNDEEPVFTITPTRLTVEENRAAGDLVGQLEVSDSDSLNVNGGVLCKEPEELQGRQAIRFSPEPRDVPDAGKFNLYTRFQFDREEQITSGSNGGVVLSRLICHDQGRGSGGRLTSTLTATMTIADVNDHLPRFSESMYSVTVMENNAVGALVVQVNATDLDEGDNSRITYFLQDHSNFRINENTGLVVAAKEFDRESQDTYQVLILAQDNGSPPKSSSVLLKVTIGDTNDHIPEMRGPTIFEVVENRSPGQGLGALIAEDRDLGPNGNLIFTLLPSKISPLFTLYENGSLFTAARFDREVQSEYKFRVRVSDLNVKQAQSITTSITVKIKDENDNYPMFDGLITEGNTGSFRSNNGSNSVAHISVHEAPGYPVLMVHATDPDEGVNAHILYRLKEQSLGGLLTLNEETGQLQLVRRMTRGNLGQYKVVVVAEDQGNPKLQTQKILTIILEDTPAKGDQYRLSGFPGGHGGRNIMIVIILSSVSAFLATVLITAILCMVRPCSKWPRGASESRHSRHGGGGLQHTDPFLHPGGGQNHQLYDLHGGGGYLYDKKTGGVGTLPPGMGESLLSGMDGTGFLPGQFHMVGCPAGHDQNWTLPSPRRLSGSLCVDSTRPEGDSGSPESERRDHTGTLPNKPLRGGKKSDQIRMWAYDSSCGKCGTLGSRGYGVGQGGGGGINGVGGNEEQSDSGRGGSDEDLCHHNSVHNQYGIPIGQPLPLVQPRNCLMQTFQAPASPSLATAQQHNRNNTSCPDNSNTLTRGTGSVGSLSRFPVSQQASGIIPPPSSVVPISSSAMFPARLPTAAPSSTNGVFSRPPLPPAQYTPSTRLPVTPFSATLSSSLAPRPLPANQLVTSSSSGSTAPLTTGPTSAASAGLSTSGDNREVNPKTICDEIDQLFFKDML